MSASGNRLSAFPPFGLAALRPFSKSRCEGRAETENVTGADPTYKNENQRREPEDH
jgi:hypothetical protein